MAQEQNTEALRADNGLSRVTSRDYPDGGAWVLYPIPILRIFPHGKGVIHSPSGWDQSDHT